MSRPLRHVFVCENLRPDGGKPSCGARGGAELRRLIETALLADPSLWDRIRVTACGCLGPCFDGPTLVVYPEGIYYAGVAPDDIDELLASHLVGGRPVERLVYHWPEQSSDP